MTDTILFLDFDGTLAEIQSTPDGVYLEDDQFALLKRLTLGHSLFVISGRSFKDIQKRVPNSLAGIAGDHGAVRFYKDQYYVLPAAHSIRDIVQTLGNEFHSLQKEFPGALIERKEYSVSVHYRNISPKKVPELKEMISLVKSKIDKLNTLKETPGKCVWEFRHPEATKESALKWFVQKLEEDHLNHREKRYVMVGDDVTDWNAILWAQQSGGRGIWIGKSMPEQIKTNSPGLISSPKELWEILDRWDQEKQFIPFFE